MSSIRIQVNRKNNKFSDLKFENLEKLKQIFTFSQNEEKVFF